MASLNLPASPHAAVWAVLVRALRADTTYLDAGITLVFPEGDRESAADLDDSDAGVRFTPGVGGARWFDEASASSDLRVAVEVSLRRPDADDLLNLQNALLSTLNTISGDLRGDLCDAGANTGLLLFDQPFQPSPAADGRLRARGGFSLEVLRTL
jgi:hypothetical protein